MLDHDLLKLPRIFLFWDKSNPVSEVTVNMGNRIQGDSFCSWENFRPVPTFKENTSRSGLVIGNSIVNDRVDRKCAVKQLLEISDSEKFNDFCHSLNGQFIVILFEKKENRLLIGNDRFCSLPFYYYDTPSCFLGSFLFFDLFKKVQAEDPNDLNREAFLEFIHFQRLLGDKTYHNKIKCLLGGQALHIDPKKTHKSRYWRPDFEKTRYSSLSHAGATFCSLLTQSVNRLTKDLHDPFGLFLSGGHDSRTILSAFEQTPVCYTLAFNDNYEVDCARQAANAVDAQHRFLSIRDNHFSMYQDSLAKLCGGLYATDNALFVGYEYELQKEGIGVVFHGHGLDYMFQGMYVPATTIKLFDRPTFFRRLAPLSSDVAVDFIEKISFRLVNPNALEFAKPSRRAELKEWLINSVQEVMRNGEDSFNTNYDRWEYLIMHALGRHYSYPNILSKMTLAETRTITFDNDLFDFYLSLPLKYRLHAGVMRYALNHLRPKLGLIPTGNYGIRAGASPLYKTSFLIGRKLLRHITGKSHLHAPDAKDRTWPDRDEYLRSHARYKVMVQEAVYSPYLESYIDYFDWSKIRSQFDVWMNQSSGGGG